ncbi:MAG: c-type cytochrome, partial [Verrucomicrobiota bacterium]
MLPSVSLFAADENWSAYLGDPEASHYSTLKQINRKNVQRLEIAWTYDAKGEDPENRSQIQCNPLAIDGALYGTTAMKVLFALDGATGEELWTFDPFEKEGNGSVGVNRGLAYWKDGDDERILYGVQNWLYAIDLKTGELVETFGEGGRIDLKNDLGIDASRLQTHANTPGAIYKDLIIMPMRVGEGPGKAAPGHLRAYNVRTGELAWRFNTIPHPGEFGYETWPEDAWKRVGGANVWTGITVDRERGMIFAPTGSASFDFWGGNRKGENLFANCLLAIVADTGERIWHYQFVRHDLWDRDLPASPNLCTVKREGKKIDAVAQITKSGHVFVFNRETGEPLFPIEEIMTPPSDLKQEEAWPSQPLPTKPEPFARQVLTVEELSDITPETYREVLDRFVTLRPHAPFMPPSEEGTIIFPGFDGGGEWGGAAVDPKGIMYVNGNEMAWVLTMVDIDKGMELGERLYFQNCAGCHGADLKGSAGQNVPSLFGVSKRISKKEAINTIRAGKGVMPPFAYLSESDAAAVAGFLFENADEAAAEKKAEAKDPNAIPYTHTGYRRWFDSKGYPAVKPPWGTLNAIDLNTGEYLWKTTLGEFEELSEMGITPTGTENYGGPVVTASGLLFIAASKDEYFRVFDAKTGEELKKIKLPAGGYATPTTYWADGKQYVAIACGGGKMGTKSDDVYVTFALS